MTRPTGEPRDKVRDKMDIHLPGVIKTLGEAMYTDPWVALRELIQNANDTCTIRRAPSDETRQPRDPDAPPPAVRIYYDRYNARLTVEDNGAGMTWDEVRKFLAVIGRSNTDDCREQLERLGEASWADRLIGRFGLGLLSAFIIGAPVEFETRSYRPDSPTVWWQCEGGQHYEMGRLDTPREVGTTVTIHVDPAHRAMFQNEDDIIRRIKLYADLLEIPICYGPSGAQRRVNVGEAPWMRPGGATSQEYLRYLQARFPDDSILHVIPVEIEEPATETQPALRLGGALFIPKQPDPLRAFVKEFGTVSVYVRRMFVTENEPELLPRWAKFVKGVIDSPDLRETTSRESVRHDESFFRARRALGGLILRTLQDLAENDNRHFREIAAQHDVVIKLMAIAEPELFDAVRDIVLFRVENRIMSLETYFREAGTSPGAQPGQKRTIYYSANKYGLGQHGFLFAQRGWRVIDAASYPDEPFLITYQKRFPDQVELVSLDTAGDRVFVELNPKEDRWLNLEDAFLRNRIEATVVKFEPADIPAVLVDTKDEHLSDDQLARAVSDDELPEQVKGLFRDVKAMRDRRRRMMLAAGAILYLNANSDIIQTLAERNLDDAETVDVMIVLYNNALMLSTRALHPDQAKKIFDGNNRTIKQLMRVTDEIKSLRQAGADPDRVRLLREQLDALRREAEAMSQALSQSSRRASELAAQKNQLERDLDEAKRQISAMTEELARFRSDQRAPAACPYVRCFVAMPFHGLEPLFAALRAVLQGPPYFFEVLRADKETTKARVSDNVQQFIESCDCYVMDVSDENSNVMMELGYAYWSFPNRPLLLLRRAGAGEKLADLGDTIYLEYEWPPGVPLGGAPGAAGMDPRTVEELSKQLTKLVARHQPFASQRKEKRFLSVYCLPSNSYLLPALRDVAQRYKTIEDFVEAVEANPAAVVTSIPGLGEGTIQDLKTELKRVAGL